MEPTFRDACHKAATLFFDGLIAYTTLTQVTQDIANVMGMDHRYVQLVVDKMCDSWDVE